MPTPTYSPIASVTLAAGSSEVVLAGIPQTFRDLVIVSSIKTDATNAELRIRFNGDTASNYVWIQMAAGSSVFANGGTFAFQPVTPNAFISTTNFETSIVHIIDYSATDKHKSVISRYNSVTGTVNSIAGRWTNTAAINSITISPTASVLSTNCTFNIYGVIA